MVASAGGCLLVAIAACQSEIDDGYYFQEGAPTTGSMTGTETVTTGGMATTGSTTSGTTGQIAGAGGSGMTVTSSSAVSGTTTSNTTGDSGMSSTTGFPMSGTGGSGFGDTSDTTGTTGNNAVGGAGGDDEDTANATSGGTDSGTSGEACRVMQGNIPVCCTPQGDERADVDEVLELLNAYRTSLGIDALAHDPALEEAMQGHCQHMNEANFFDHISPVASLAEPWDRAELCGTSANAENIARGQRSAAQVMQGWQNSSGHDRNMRSENSSRVGIGKSGDYWGQIFGR